MEVCLGDQDAEFYHSDTEDWQTRQTKSVDLDGDYVDQNVKGDCVEKIIKQYKSKYLTISK